MVTVYLKDGQVQKVEVDGAESEFTVVEMQEEKTEEATPAQGAEASTQTEGEAQA